MVMVYTSLENKKIKELRKLKQRKYRDKTNHFFFFLKHLVEEAYQTGCLDTIILLEENQDVVSYSDVEVMVVTKEIMKVLSDVETPPNIMGVCHKPELSTGQNKILLLDGVQDPGNLGTIIRSAVAFHVDMIYVGKNSVDVYNPKVIRSSQGMIFKVPIQVVALEEIIPELKKLNIPIIGTKVTGGNRLKSFPKLEKFAIIMGNEGNGVRSEILDLCDQYLYIDMKEDCESLNVAVATSIILYELDK